MNGRKLRKDARGVRWKGRDKKEVNNFYVTVLNKIMFAKEKEILKPMKGE